MIKLEDFTNKELINAIVNWQRDVICKKEITTELVLDMINDLEDSAWLEYYNKRLAAELPHSNC